MLARDFLVAIRDLDDCLEVYIASTVLMPLAQVTGMGDEEGCYKIVFYQQRRDNEDIPLESSRLGHIREYCQDFPDADIRLFGVYERDLESLSVHTIANTKKTGNHKVVAVKEAWDAHPVNKDSAREALVLFTPL